MTASAQRFFEKVAQDLSSEEIIFPTCFHITLKVRDLLRNPDISIEQIANGLMTEPVIVAKLIKLANSVAMMPAQGGEVHELKSAIARVGLKTVKSVSFSVAMEQLVRSRNMAAFTDLSKKIWEHCILTAALSRQFARHGRRVRPDEAFFAGLVHDIGAFYLLFCASQEEEFAQGGEEVNQLVANWHDGIGHALLDALGQNTDELLMAVQDHESTEPIKNLTTLTNVLRAANQVANMHASWRPHEIIEDLASLNLPLDEPSLRTLVDQSLEDVEELRASLSI